MKASIAQLMQQAQKMQENLKQAQQELAQLEIVGEAGAGMVEIRMNGRHEVRSVKIDAGAMEDREMLEDLPSTMPSTASRKPIRTSSPAWPAGCPCRRVSPCREPESARGLNR